MNTFAARCILVSIGMLSSLGLAATCSSGGQKTQIGEITTLVLPLARIGGSSVNDGHPIRAGDKLTTDRQGQVRFRIEPKLYECEATPLTSLDLRSSAGTVMNLDAGSTSCVTAPGGPPIELEIGGRITIAVDDPVFKVAINGDVATVKVSAGEVAMRSATGEVRKVSSGQQATTRLSTGVGAGAIEIRALELDPGEKDILTRLEGLLRVSTPKPVATLTPTRTRTPTATATPCPPLSKAQLGVNSVSNQNEVRLSWHVSGGCSPLTGTWTAKYQGEAQPYFKGDFSSSLRSGELSDKPPVHCEGTFSVLYALTLRDTRGSTATSSTTTKITWIC
jgi:hypothetical protein